MHACGQAGDGERASAQAALAGAPYARAEGAAHNGGNTRA